MTLPASVAVGPEGRVTADVVIVGAGIAGLFAACHLPAGLDVVVVDKGRTGRSGSSPWAQGGMAAAVGAEDSPDLHAADTHAAGAGMCDPRATAVLARAAPARVRDLLDLGAVFDRSDGGDGGARTVDDLHLAREGGHSVARSVHRADATGAEIVRVLREAARPRVRRLAGIAVAFAGEPDGPVAGVWVLADGRLSLVSARAVLLAAGGCGALFAATTNQDGATGDGVALAAAAGATVRDLEFVQFHPTGLAVTGTWRFLLTEALRGAGATLHAEDGARFMVDVHPDAELAPRHVVAAAILSQPGGRARLDARGIGADRLEEEFPTVLHGAREHGFDLATERVPVTPAAHYMVGGVRTDLAGRTSVPGLYAAGEVASTGVHGANRMAGNSLAEAVVFGRRAARTLLGELPPSAPPPGPEPALDGRVAADTTAVRTRLRELMWEHAGPVRDAGSLQRARSGLAALADELGDPGPNRDHVELALALRTARLVVRAAALRTESRGGHIRDDHPDPDPTWATTRTELTLPTL